MVRSARWSAVWASSYPNSIGDSGKAPTRLNFKPFLYASALRAGITPSTVINDAPVVLDNLAAAEIWRPENDSGKFYGPTRLRRPWPSHAIWFDSGVQRVGVRAFIVTLRPWV